MKVTALRKPVIKSERDLKPVNGNNNCSKSSHCNGALKSAMVVPRHPPIREAFVPKSSAQRYAELPSLRYGPTPTPTATQMLGSGPLRVYPQRQASLRSSKRLSSHELVSQETPLLDKRFDTLSLREPTPAAVRRVRFADLPPKFHSFESERSGVVEDWTSTCRRDTATRTLSGRGGEPSSSVDTNRRDPAVPRATPKLGNQGTYIGGTVLRNPLAGRENRHRRIPPVPATLPPLLRAARADDDAELLDLLRKAALLGIPVDELNAADPSGRTAVSFIAASGTLSTLEAILQLPGLDINKSDNEGNTPLHFAAQAGHTEIVNHMLSHCMGLDVDSRNSLGFTPLMKAALQGRTKCAKLLLFAGASPTMKDTGRGLRAEQWARFCGRYICAEVIEKFARHRMLDRNTSQGRWGSEPELAARILTGKAPQPTQINQNLVHTNSIKNKLRRAFRTTSSPGPDCPPPASFSIVTQLTSAALCASSPLLPSTHATPIAPLVRPLSVPRLQVTLAGSNTSTLLVDEEAPTAPAEDPSEPNAVIKERPPTARPINRTKKKK